MRRFNLRFVVQTRPQERAPVWDSDWHLPEEYIVFRFAAEEFPRIENFSWNNPKT